jgi:hypothetical protein
MSGRTPARRLRLKGIGETRADASALLVETGDAFLIERGRMRWIIFKCPCGCGEQLPINLDPRAGPAWRLYRGKKGVTLFPSVWRDTGCESHFIVWDDAYLMFDRDRYQDDGQHDAVEPEEVLKNLPASGLLPYVDIADRIGAVPWAVLSVCRDLVRAGLAREGRGDTRGQFGQPK